jgi:hypothetical protein
VLCAGKAAEQDTNDRNYRKSLFILQNFQFRSYILSPLAMDTISD